MSLIPPADERARIGGVVLLRADGAGLLQHRDDKPGLSAAGLWVFPGGHCEPGETCRECARREFLEETGMQIKVKKLLLAESSEEDHNISLIYLCEIVSGMFEESNEISEMRYFDVKDLPHMLFAEKNLIHLVAKIVNQSTIS